MPIRPLLNIIVLRIDLLITEMHPGGAERALTELAMGLAESGDEVRVFSVGTLPEGNKASLVDRLKNDGIEVRSANADRVWQFRHAKSQIESWISENPPDLLQCFLFHANVLGSEALANKKIAESFSKPAPILFGGIRVAQPRVVRSFLEKRALRRMDHVVCVSEAVASFAQRDLSVDASRCSVIANGVDSRRFSNANPVDWTVYGLPADAKVILFVGRLAEQKRVLEMLQHADHFLSTDPKAHLVLIGEGPQGPKVDQLIKDRSLQRVHRLGWQEDVAPFYAASYLLLMPSRYEGMPNVLLEAMAAGLPVAASKAEGVDEVLVTAPEGQSYPVGDDQKMVKVVNGFLRDPEGSRSIGEANAAIVRRSFAWPTMIDSYRRLFSQYVVRRDEED